MYDYRTSTGGKLCEFFRICIVLYCIGADACRDIAQGEELLLSYGPAWEEAWVSYLDALLQWHDTLALLEYLGKYGELEVLKKQPPQFRSAIAAPSGFFPASFFGVECLGRIPCAGGLGVGGERESAGDHGAEEMAAVLQARRYAVEHFAEGEGEGEGEGGISESESSNADKGAARVDGHDTVKTKARGEEL